MAGWQIISYVMLERQLFIHNSKSPPHNRQASMKNLPLVTLVIPTFNQQKYLPACVDHCIFQTYQNLEMIIVDGGSTDSSKAYISTLTERIASTTMNPVSNMRENGEIIRKSLLVYPQNRHIKIITFQHDIGPTSTINEGLKRARGKYCTYIVGDDLPHPHMIEEMVAVLEGQSIDFVYSDMNLVDDAGRIIRQMIMPDYDFEKCFAQWYHLGVSKLYRTILHERVGLMDQAYCAANDYDQYLRFAMAGCRFHHLPKILYSVRWHGPERKTGQHTPKRYKNLKEESRRCAMRARAWIRRKSQRKQSS